MEVFGQLNKAQLENTTDAPDKRGGVIFDTAVSEVKYHDGTVVRTVVNKDQAQTLTNKTIVVANNTLTTAATGNLAATELNAALNELQLDIDNRATSTALSDHITDTGDAHDASAISNTPSGSIVATDVQSALNELDSDLSTHMSDTSTHGVGEIVGRTETQTLTNKTLTAPAITSPTGIVKGDVGLGNVDNTSDATKNAASVTLTNKTLTAPIIDDALVMVEEASAPSTPSAGYKKVYPKNDGKLYTLDSSGNELEVGSGGGGGGINYIENPSAETNTTGASTYADAAGTIPVDGTGGSPTTTLLRESNPLALGPTCYSMDKPASNCQGNGASFTFAINTVMANKPHKISFYYAPAGSFTYGSIDGVTPSDVTVYVYDVDNSVLIKAFPYTLTGDGYFSGQFQTTNATNYRLLFHVGTTNASAWTLYFSEVTVSPSHNIFIQSDSDWVSYTPTFGNFGTVVSIDFQYRKEGADLLIRGNAVAGTTAAGIGTISLPTGLVTATLPANLNYAGDLRRDAANANTINLLSETGATTVFLSGNNGTSNQLTKTNTSVLVNTGNKFSVAARVPIQGWTSGYATPGVSAQNVPVTFFANKAGGAISTNTTIPTWTNVLKDSVGAFNATSGVYTVKVPGDYFVNASLTMGSSTVTLAIRKNGNIVANFNAGVSGTRKQTTALLPNLVVGDTITLTISGNDTIGATAEESTWSIYKIVDPSAFLTIPKVATIKDLKAANTQGGTATSGSFFTRTLNTLVDPFGITSLASNQFVLQPGTYKINAAATGFACGRTKIKLRNITASSDTSIGMSVTGSSADNVIVPLTEVFSITVATTFEIQQRVETTQASNGQGVASNFSVDEIYTTVEIQKLL